MSSKRVEDAHTTMLDRLLADSGLECIRSVPLSEEEEEEETEEELVIEAEEEAASELVPEEEEQRPPEEAVPEEPPYVFPTPSLRRMIPERLRRIEDQNRIKVLPKDFNTYIDPAAIPKINVTPRQRYIDILAELTGCTQYRSSLAEYWFLDTLANLLRRSQEDEMPRQSQAILILWFCEWMKEMQQFDAASRERMLRRWKDNMLTAARYIGERDLLPTPDQAGVYYKARDPIELEETSKMTIETPEGAYECALRDLTKIIHYIYDLFGTNYQYDLVRSIFTFSPGYTLIDAANQIQIPKRIYVPLKAKAGKGSPKKEKAPKPAKGKSKEPDTEEYLALLALKERERRELEELEEIDRENWNKKSHILPLGFAATEEFFNKYWPPPTPEPEPIPEPDPKGKPKEKKGKK